MRCVVQRAQRVAQVQPREAQLVLDLADLLEPLAEALRLQLGRVLPQLQPGQRVVQLEAQLVHRALRVLDALRELHVGRGSHQVRHAEEPRAQAGTGAGIGTCKEGSFTRSVAQHSFVRMYVCMHARMYLIIVSVLGLPASAAALSSAASPIHRSSQRSYFRSRFSHSRRRLRMNRSTISEGFTTFFASCAS